MVFHRPRNYPKPLVLLNTLKYVLPNILFHLNYGDLLWGPKLHVNDKMYMLQKSCSNYYNM